MNMYKKFLMLLGGLLLTSSLLACGIFGGTQEDTTGELSKEEELVLEEAIRERKGDQNKNRKPRENGDTVKSKWGPDSATAVKKYSLYYTYYKQDNYKEAYKHWRWMFFNAPRQSVNLYIRGVNLVEFKLNKASAQKREAYIDTLMMVYDKRIKYFNKKGYVLGRKGMNLIQIEPSQAKRAFDILDRSLQIDGKGTKSYVPYYYVYAAVQLKKQDELTKNKLLEAYDKAEKIVLANLKEGGGSKWKDTRDKIEGLISPYLSCADLIREYKPKFKENKGDLEKLKIYQSDLQRKGCTKDPFYLQISEAVFSKEPSAELAVTLARNWQQKKNTDKAIKYYKKAMEQEEDKKMSAQHALSLASLYKNQKSDLLEAKKYAKKAIALNANYGKAYIFLGDLYIAGKDKCGDGFKKAAVHWVAVDKYEKAGQVDESVKSLAEKRINAYSQLYPKKEKIFFEELEEGDPYTVKCWINEKTTVRIPD